MTTKIKKLIQLYINIQYAQWTSVCLQSFYLFFFGKKTRPQFLNIWIIAPIPVHLVLSDEQSVFAFLCS